MNKIKTAEFVSPKHPDKICDFIVDVILDAFLAKDPQSRVALEASGGHNQITISGEVTSKAKVNIESVVKRIVGRKFKVRTFISQQSPFIASGVDGGGAGDQGIMVGYATRETSNLMPLEYELARNLCYQIYQIYPFDGKTQVTIEGKKVLTVVASFQNTKTKELEELVRKLIKAENYLINPAGEWSLGGFDADSGVSGRKIVVDSYGPEVNVGGGSFSGKDYTKVDRSGAYMARKIAVDYLKKHKASEAKVKLAYAIGEKYPVMAVAEIDGKQKEVKEYDLSPLGIYRFLKLAKIKWQDTAIWGHFGRGFSWDK
jgi:S-adenosylmethionine synthetase